MPVPSFNAVRFDSADAAASDDGQIVHRFDISELSKPTKTKDGFFRAEGILKKPGVYTYAKPDGTTFREFHPPEVVFSAETIRSFAQAPITNGHPPDNLTPKTVRKYAVGSVGNPERVGDTLRAAIRLDDEQAIHDAERGKTGLSCGYSARVYAQPGVWVDAAGIEQRFDTIQTELEGNHVAQCWKGRVGDARIRMDALDASEEGHVAPAKAESPPKPEGDKPMPKRKIGDKEFDVQEEVAARLDVALALEAKAAQNAQLSLPVTPRADAEEVEALKKRVEEQSGELAVLKSQTEKRTDEERKAADRAARIEEDKERLRVVMVSVPILKKPYEDLLVMDQEDIMRAVVSAERPKWDIAKSSSSEIKGMFRALTDGRVDTAAEMNKFIGAAKTASAARADESDLEKRRDEARKKHDERASNAWKPKVAS